jgi:hypothetical protein
MRFSSRLALALALGWAFIPAAYAQTNLGQSSPDSSVIAVPPAPPIVASPSSIPSQTLAPPAAPPPGLVQTPVPPGNADNGQPATDSSAGATAPAAPPPIPWLPGKTAVLGVLNKVDGSVSSVTIPVGGQAKLGDLQVSVLACVSRPPDQIPDAAIFIATQNTTDKSQTPAYRGWIIRSAPGAAVVGDASETFRAITCS